MDKNKVKLGITPIAWTMPKKHVNTLKKLLIFSFVTISYTNMLLFIPMATLRFRELFSFLYLPYVGQLRESLSGSLAQNTPSPLIYGACYLRPFLWYYLAST